MDDLLQIVGVWRAAIPPPGGDVPATGDKGGFAAIFGHPGDAPLSRGILQTGNPQAQGMPGPVTRDLTGTGVQTGPAIGRVNGFTARWELHDGTGIAATKQDGTAMPLAARSAECMLPLVPRWPTVSAPIDQPAPIHQNDTTDQDAEQADAPVTINIPVIAPQAPEVMPLSSMQIPSSNRTIEGSGEADTDGAGIDPVIVAKWVGVTGTLQQIDGPDLSLVGAPQVAAMPRHHVSAQNGNSGGASVAPPDAHLRAKTQGSGTPLSDGHKVQPHGHRQIDGAIGPPIHKTAAPMMQPTINAPDGVASQSLKPTRVGPQSIMLANGPEITGNPMPPTSPQVRVTPLAMISGQVDGPAKADVSATVAANSFKLPPRPETETAISFKGNIAQPLASKHDVITTGSIPAIPSTVMLQGWGDTTNEILPTAARTPTLTSGMTDADAKEVDHPLPTAPRPMPLGMPGGIFTPDLDAQPRGLAFEKLALAAPLDGSTDKSIPTPITLDALVPPPPTPAQINAPAVPAPVPTSQDTALVTEAQIAPLDDPGIGVLSASTSATTSTAPAAVASPPAQAQSAAQQIAAALASPDQPRHGGHPIEIALDPPELGRVRLTLTEVNGALTLTIVADRPDTVDLMRRHLDLLAQEFARAGLGGPSVNLSQNGGGGADRGNASAANAPPRRHGH